MRACPPAHTCLLTPFRRSCPRACSKAVGHKFGPHLPRSVPLCIRYLRSAAEGDEELREYCLQVRGPPSFQCLIRQPSNQSTY